MDIPQLIYLSIDEHLGCFYLWAIMHNASLNIRVQIIVWTNVFISLGCIHPPRSGIAASHGNSMFNF